jgi:hypothetical protein
MSISEWTELSAVTERLASLKSQGQAAAAAGDFDTAGYFFRLANEAEVDRKRVLERLLNNIGDVV